jgi:hypothetical protein
LPGICSIAATDLAGQQELFCVNHSKEYQTKGDVNTNHVGSFFSRIQPAHVGMREQSKKRSLVRTQR